MTNDGAKPDPEQLLSMARQGRDQSLGQLLELYRSYVQLLARLQIGRRLQDKVDSSDLVQETFLDAHRCFGQFRGSTEGEFLVWLRKILASKIANLLRHYYGTQSRDLRSERQLDEELERSSIALAQGLVVAESSPSQRAARREQAVLLSDALNRLPEDYREVIILRHLEERNFPEVAECMDRTVDSVKNLWARALAQLRRSLGESP